MAGSIKQAAQRSAEQSAQKPIGVAAALLKRGPKPEKKRWEFSFRHFQQIEQFGLDGKGIPNAWLVSMLERLKQLSQEPIENILDDQTIADAYRYHPIDWGAKNIPIGKEALEWIGEPYKSNPEEYPVDQIMLSKGTGRIVGFFDEGWVFNLVLIDPLHNLQPARSFDYAVNPSSPLTCELTQLQVAVGEGMTLCQTAGCKANERVADALAGRTYSESYGLVLIKMTDASLLADARALMAQTGRSYADILELGIISLNESHGTASPAVPGEGDVAPQ